MQIAESAERTHRRDAATAFPEDNSDCQTTHPTCIYNFIENLHSRAAQPPSIARFCTAMGQAPWCNSRWTHGPVPRCAPERTSVKVQGEDGSARLGPQQDSDGGRRYVYMRRRIGGSGGSWQDRGNTMEGEERNTKGADRLRFRAAGLTRRA